jgi:hypothetical protein
MPIINWTGIQKMPKRPGMGMKLGLTPEKKAHLLDLERSARAELKLRHKASEYYRDHIWHNLC